MLRQARWENPFMYSAASSAPSAIALTVEVRRSGHTGWQQSVV
jgi:hypothetical protein